MKLEIGLVAVAFVAGVAFQPQKDTPQEGVQDWGENPMENPEFMRAWQAAMTPGEEHEQLASMAGSWKVESTIHMEPGGEGVTAPATAECRTILGGRYLLQDYSSEFMGMPMEGLLILGYDNVAEEYFSIWMDNMSTWPSIARGVEEDSGKIVQIGSMRDVMTPQGRPYRHITWHEGEDIMHTEMYDTLPDGTEWKVMAMTYRRQ